MFLFQLSIFYFKSKKKKHQNVTVRERLSLQAHAAADSQRYLDNVVSKAVEPVIQPGAHQQQQFLTTSPPFTRPLVQQNELDLDKLKATMRKQQADQKQKELEEARKHQVGL